MNLLHRSLAQLFVLAVIVPAVGAVPAEAAPPPGQTPAPDRVRLVGEPGSVVRSASYRLGPAELTRVADTRRFRTARLSSTTYRMVALTWRGDDAAALRIRSRTEGHWSLWRKLAPLTDLPDATSGEGNGVHGTELLWVGPSDGIQVIVRGHRPKQLTLQLIDPGELESDSDVVTHPRPGTARGSGRRCAPAGSALPQAVGCRRELAQRWPLLRPHHPAGAHPPHGNGQRLHEGRRPGADPGHVPLPHARPRLVRHRLQLPGRQVRPLVGGPRGRGEEASSVVRTPSASTTPRPGSR